MKQQLSKEFKEGVQQKLQHYTNLKLMNEILMLAGGDGYDGCFSVRGRYEYEQMVEELSKRLREAGFLKPEENCDY